MKAVSEEDIRNDKSSIHGSITMRADAETRQSFLFFINWYTIEHSELPYAWAQGSFFMPLSEPHFIRFETFWVSGFLRLVILYNYE